MTERAYYAAMAIVAVLGGVGSLANWLLTQKLRADLAELKTYVQDRFPDIKFCNERHTAVNRRIEALEAEL